MKEDIEYKMIYVAELEREVLHVKGKEDTEWRISLSERMNDFPMIAAMKPINEERRPQ